MKKVVISLGGSVIVPDRVHYKYLIKLGKLIKKYARGKKVVIVCGGGDTARKYIKPLAKLKKGAKAYSAVGISATRINAKLVRKLFDMEGKLPLKLEQVKKELSKHNLVVCGALGERTGRTSDANAVEIAKAIKANFFVNITDVSGLYNKDPKLKGAKLIKKITYGKFLKMAEKIEYKAGQHFVLDQVAAKMIRQHRIKTFIIGKNLKNLKRVLKEKKRFRGTIIS